MRFVPRLLSLLGLLLGAFPAAAHASTGGEVLPFNDTFSLIQSNLSGPTANTIAFIVAFGGAVAIGLSKQSEILKPIGTTLLVVVLIAKLPAILSAIGLAGATGAMLPFYVPLIPSAVLAVIALALYFAPGNRATGIRQL